MRWLNNHTHLIGDCAASSRNYSSNSAGTQRFDVFARGCNGTSSCATITLTILTNSTAPTSIQSSAGSSFCGGTSTTLTAQGGTHATGAQYAWYSGSCGGTLISTGISASITVTPSATTTYHVRRTGTCPAATSCASLTITIQSPPVGNNTVTGDQSVCSGQTPVVLPGSLPGGNTYTYLWESSTASASSGFAPASGTNNAQDYYPGPVIMPTWFRRSIIQVDGCSTLSLSNVVHISLGPGQCNDANPCTLEECEGNSCRNSCTLNIGNVSSTNVSIEGCVDGTISASAGFTSCSNSWNAFLYKDNSVQKTWSSASQGTSIFWENVAPGNYLIVVTDLSSCADSADVTVGNGISCNIQLSNLIAQSTSVEGCTDGTISATVNATVCNDEWQATLYNYLNIAVKNWSNQQGNSIMWTHIAAGSYRIDITDDRVCSASQNIVIESGPLCSVEIQNADGVVVNCDQNSISANIVASSCNDTWFAYLYAGNFSQLLQTWSSTEGTELNWANLTLQDYHIYVVGSGLCSDTVKISLSCSDNNPCTNDFCNGGCSHSFKCNDNNLCTNDLCDANGVCTYPPLVCNDNNPCTIDVCAGGNCSSTPKNCADVNPCTVDQCVNGNCIRTPIICNDGSSCTVDFCQGGVCNYVALCTLDDGNPCTLDQCLGGSCQNTPITCDDGLACSVDSCNGGICYQDYSACNSFTISGAIQAETAIPIGGVSVILSGTINDTVITASDGLYSFTVAGAGNYSIAPSKSNDVVTNNGVTTGDIPLIRKHVLTQNFLNSPYKIIAADANNSETITTADVTFTRRVALNNTYTFPLLPSPPIVYGRLWEFVSSDQIFSGPPYNPFPFAKTRTYNNLSENKTDQNFIGIKIGDVNNSWSSGTP